MMKSAQAPKKRIALKMFLLLLICLAPLIGALFLYQSRDSFMFATKNHGTLVLPSVSLESIGIHNPYPHRWIMAYYTPKGCDAHCEKVKEHFTTIELSLVKDQPRLGAAVFTAQDFPSQTVLPKQLFGLEDQTAIWLIDPLGNIILRYDVKALDNRLLLDIRYLLKVSQIG